MPVYTLKDTKTNQEMEINCSYNELQEILNKESDLVKMLSTPSFVSSTKTHANSKTSDGWKDLLGRIDKGAGRQSKIKK
jgi:hypothetical protein